MVEENQGEGLEMGVGEPVHGVCCHSAPGRQGRFSYPVLQMRKQESKEFPPCPPSCWGRVSQLCLLILCHEGLSCAL